MVQTALLLLAHLAALAAAASQPEISWRGGRTEFKIVHSMALHSRRRADFGNRNPITKQCETTIQRPALTLHEVYTVYNMMGHGLLAKVRQGIHRTSKKPYAIKTIDLSRIRADQRESLRRELNIMKALDQPDTIKLHETFEEEGKLYLVLEMCEGADVLEYTAALELFEYMVMKTSVLYSPQVAAVDNGAAASRLGRA